ncbi:hypothetical protein KPH14_001442 [Odynerus spinipes]|uniref:protein-synthesizing GTPase n=1 Tax=Odynerus spinipes TaxID=1348599 RepID=A0AAD9RVU9_9HYME|nr:hypothetical protein KPH14_001442 [Odynerus spinipes]
MGGEEGLGVTTGQPNLYKQDLSKLDVSKLTALSREVISRQATINIGTIGHVAHGKSTIVKAISGVQTVRFKNELERNITIKLDEHPVVRSGMAHRDIPGETSKASSAREKRPLSFETIQQRMKQPKIDEETTSYSDDSENSINLYASLSNTERVAEEKVSNNIVLSHRDNKKLNSQNNNTNWRGTSRHNGTIGIKLKELRIVLEDIKYKNLYDNNIKVETKENVWEVEKIVGKKTIDGETLYLIKWKNWPRKHNTWEPLENLVNCTELMKEFEEQRLYMLKTFKKRINFFPIEHDVHEYLKDMRRKGESIDRISVNEDTVYGNIKSILKQKCRPNGKVEQSIKSGILRLMLRDLRKEQLESLQDWEDEMNNITKRQPLIRVENLVDLESGPQNFFYIEDYLPGAGVVIPDDPPIGCECLNCGSNMKCCSVQNDSVFPYTSAGKIRISPGTPIFECNKRCKCDLTCPNRVTQRRANIKLCIFKTGDGRGWGVKTLESIKKGSFVTQYVGEVISSDEADKRGKEYDAAGRTYLFDLDYNETDDVCPYTVDAAVYGNISHFINHSCDPNLVVYGVWINCLDPNLPKLALFATKDIEKNEELTFDYGFQPLNTTWKMQENTDDERYANAKIYKCDNDKCPRPACYISGGSSKDDSFPCLRPVCPGRFQLVRHVSFVDCPGHDILMATMLNGAAVMDAALLLIAGNESCPQPQTSEHLAAIEIMKLKHIIILQNKIDLVKEAQAKEQYEQILKFVQGTVAEGAPVIPISAQLKYNIEVLCEYITKKIPVPLRDFTSEPRLIVIRSFDVNKPGCEVDDLKGGVAGGSILRGVLKVGMEIEVRPGLVSKDSEGKLTCRPIFSRIVSLFAEQNELQFAVPGGLIGVGTKIEPTLCRADRLVGQILGAVGALPKIFIELEISYYLLKRLLGVRTEGDKKGARVPKLSRNEVLLVNIGSLSTGGRVLATRADLAKISLTSPVCTEIDEKIALSRRVEKHWRLIGWGQICGGQTIEPVLDGK